MPPQLRALIFDVDGTLAETEESHRQAFNLAFAEAGLNWFWDQGVYRNLLKITGGKERIKAFCQLTGFKENSDDARIFADALHRRKTRIFEDMVDRGCISLRPGIRELVEAARGAGLRLAIATTTTLSNIEALVRVTLGPDSLTYFDVIAAGDCVKAKKPAPDVYLTVLKKLQLSPADCLALEDSENGVLASIAASVPVLVTVSSYSRDDRFDGALKVVDDLLMVCEGLVPQNGQSDIGLRILQSLRQIHERGIDRKH